MKASIFHELRQTKATTPNTARPLKHCKLENFVGAARTQAPADTNYDVDSTTWADLKQTPLLCAMEVANLGHEPS